MIGDFVLSLRARRLLGLDVSITHAHASPDSVALTRGGVVGGRRD